MNKNGETLPQQTLTEIEFKGCTLGTRKVIDQMAYLAGEL